MAGSPDQSQTAEHKQPTIRPIPTVPGFYAARFHAGTEEYLIFKQEDADVKAANFLHPLVRSFGPDTSGTSFTLRESFDTLANFYHRFHPTKAVFSQPVTVLPSINEDLGSYEVVMLAPGLVVAHSAYFVALGSMRFASWFLYGVSITPGRYVSTRQYYRERISVELDWFASGVKNTKFFMEPENIKPSPQRFQLLPPQQYSESRSVLIPRNLFVFTGDGSLYVEIDCHTLRYVCVGNEWSWVLFRCENADHQPVCPLSCLQLSIGNGWELSIKQLRS